jgi:hypothetical protein
MLFQILSFLCAGISAIMFFQAMKSAYALYRLRKKWRKQRILMRIVTQPMNDYFDYTAKTGEPYSDEGYRQFLAERGMDFNSWLALAEIVRKGVERELTQEDHS